MNVKVYKLNWVTMENEDQNFWNVFSIITNNCGAVAGMLLVGSATFSIFYNLFFFEELGISLIDAQISLADHLKTWLWWFPLTVLLLLAVITLLSLLLQSRFKAMINHFNLLKLSLLTYVFVCVVSSSIAVSLSASSLNKVDATYSLKYSSTANSNSLPEDVVLLRVFHEWVLVRDMDEKVLWIELDRIGEIRKLPEK